MLILCRPPAAEEPGRGPRRGGPRDVFAAGRVMWDRLHERGQRGAPGAAETIALASPPELPPRPPAEIAATALADYIRCPRLFWWRHVLRVDRCETAAPQEGLAPSRWGALAHRALELAVSPDGRSVEAAVDGALREATAVAASDRGALRTRLIAAVTDFWASPLGRRVAGASQVYREMPFLLDIDGTQVRGTMDLLFAGADGRWELVDYKSSVSRPAEETSPENRSAAGDNANHHSAPERYEVQLGLYAMAAGAWLGRPVTRATIAPVGGGEAAEHDLTAEDLRRIRSAAIGALTGIASSCYSHIDRVGCRWCRIVALCHPGSS